MHVQETAIQFLSNDCLEKGPNGIPHIFNLLLNFRSHPIGLTADIEKAFYLIVINPKDLDALRFLWIDDIMKARPNINRIPILLTS